MIVLVSGCVIKETRIVERDRSNETVSSQQIQAEVHTAPRQTRSFPVTTQSTKQSSMSEGTCDLLYTAYKQCYGLGIQLNNTDMCVESGVTLADRISSQYGNSELGTAFGSICAIACESANRNMAMPSEAEFSQSACD